VAAKDPLESHAGALLDGFGCRIRARKMRGKDIAGGEEGDKKKKGCSSAGKRREKGSFRRSTEGSRKTIIPCKGR